MGSHAAPRVEWSVCLDVCERAVNVVGAVERGTAGAVGIVAGRVADINRDALPQNKQSWPLFS